jgi:CTP-dependent riboflavin kinase
MIEMETVNPAACVEVIKLIEELRDAIQLSKDGDTVNFNINTAMWDQTATDMDN